MQVAVDCVIDQFPKGVPRAVIHARKKTQHPDPRPDVDLALHASPNEFSSSHLRQNYNPALTFLGHMEASSTSWSVETHKRRFAGTAFSGIGTDGQAQNRYWRSLGIDKPSNWPGGANGAIPRWSRTWRATAYASKGGTAFPIWRYRDDCLPIQGMSGGNV